MSLIDRIFVEPELRDDPAVLVDVGAAGGIHPLWRRIARYCIGVGFEPDSREAAPLGAGPRMFRRWVFCTGLVLPRENPDAQSDFFLTRSPQCSSVLRPDDRGLQPWLFSGRFAVERSTRMSCITLADGLAAQGIRRIDWLKCDTQGLDLGIFMSLSPEMRHRVLAVEFEPGLIDAYQGEIKLWETIRAMESEPFWLWDMEVCGTPRGNAGVMAQVVPPAAHGWMQRLAPVASAWANLRYLRDPGRQAGLLGRREYLLSWVFAMTVGQEGHALVLAAGCRDRFGDALSEEMVKTSRRALLWRMALRFPGWAWRRLVGAQ